jgi:hypothetical protein
MDGGRAEEQPTVPARGSRELTASVRSSGWCRGVWKKGCSQGGAPFIAGGGGGTRAT